MPILSDAVDPPQTKGLVVAATVARLSNGQPDEGAPPKGLGSKGQIGPSGAGPAGRTVGDLDRHRPGAFHIAPGLRTDCGRAQGRLIAPFLKQIGEGLERWVRASEPAVQANAFPGRRYLDVQDQRLVDALAAVELLTERDRPGHQKTRKLEDWIVSLVACLVSWKLELWTCSSMVSPPASR